jgi:signal transduction histidine kinase
VTAGFAPDDGVLIGPGDIARTAAGGQCSVENVTVTGTAAGAQQSSSEPLWRAIAVFRFASVGYAVLRLGFIDPAQYSRPDWAWAAIAVMAAWTVGTTIAYTRPEGRSRLLLSADLVVTVGLLLSTAGLQYPNAPTHGALPVTATWMAGPVLAWAVRYGRRAGTIVAVIMACADFLLQRKVALSAGLNGAVLLLLTGWIVGHLARLAAQVEAERQHAIEVEAASRERERLARHIHDSVLQVLALVQRQGTEAGGAAAELGRLAGQQEAALRALVGDGWAGSQATGASGNVDLRQLILPAQTDRVTVSVPAQAVLLEKTASAELTAAMRAALDNVRRHCDAETRAWVLVEDEPDLIRVTIRDDGPGIPDGRLAEAAAAGRFGISHSISGRLRDLGGSAVVSSVTGEGTVVELRLPRVAGVPVAPSPGNGLRCRRERAYPSHGGG